MRDDGHRAVLSVAAAPGPRGVRLSRAPGGGPPWRPARHARRSSRRDRGGGWPRPGAGSGRAKSTGRSRSRARAYAPPEVGPAGRSPGWLCRPQSSRWPPDEGRRTAAWRRADAAPRPAPRGRGLVVGLVAAVLLTGGSAARADAPAPAPCRRPPPCCGVPRWPGHRWSPGRSTRPPPAAAGAPRCRPRGVPGEPVLAAGAGVVRSPARWPGVPVVGVGHADGLRTTYEPVQPTVQAGEAVGAGFADRSCSLAGHPGCPVAACLHWGLLRGPAATRSTSTRCSCCARRGCACCPDAVIPAPPARQALSASLARRCRTALVCIWQIRLSVTPSTWPISARVRPS